MFKLLRKLLKGETNPAKSEEELSLIRACLADYKNNAPRLRYAQWLKQRHNPLGEFIELDIACDEMDEYDPRYDALDERRDKLLFAHGKEWHAGLIAMGIEPVDEDDDTFYLDAWIERGLISTITFYDTQLTPENVAEFFQAAPAMYSISIFYEAPDVIGLCAAPQMAQVRELDFLDTITLDDVEAMFHSEHLSGLVSLGISENPFGRELGDVISGGRLLPQLEELVAMDCALGDEGAAALAKGDFARMKKLVLRDNEFGNRGFEAVAGGRFDELVELDLSGNEPEAEGLIALLTSEGLPKLRSLNLSNCGLYAETFGACAASFKLPSVDHLDLCRNELGDSGIRLAAKASWFNQVRSLDVSANGITLNGLTDLIASSKWILEELNLSQNEIGDEGISFLAKSEKASSLRKLGIDSCRFGTAGMRALAESPHLSGLTHLSFGENDVDEEGAIMLSRSTQLNSLIELNFELELSGAARQALRDRFGIGVVNMPGDYDDDEDD